MSKICFVLPCYDPNETGHFYHLHEFIGQLTKNYQIFVLAESGYNPVQIRGIDGYYVQKFKLLPLRLLERVFVLIAIYLKGYRKYYCHYADIATIIASFLTRTFGGTTYKWHSVQEHYYSKPFEFKFLLEKLVRELPLHLSLISTQYLVTSSQEMKTYYQRTFNLPLEKIIIIPNYVNLKRFKPPNKPKAAIKKSLKLPNKPILLFVHHFSKRKGIDRIIKYAQEIKAQKLPFLVLVIGKGPYAKHLTSQLSKQHLTNQVMQLGAIPNRRLPRYYQASDIFIMPSRVEEFARVLLEAMASGLPIVATQTLSTKSIFSEFQKQYVTSQQYHINLPKIANQIYQDKKLCKRLAKEGLSQVQQYDLQVVKKLFVTKIFPPTKLNLLYFTSSLSRAGKEDGFIIDWVEGLAKQVDKMTVIILKDQKTQLRVKNVKVYSLQNQKTKLFKILYSFKVILANHRQEPFTGSFTHMYDFFGVYSGLIGKLFRIRSIMWYAWGLDPKKWTLAHLALNLNQIIVTCSEATKASYLKFYNLKTPTYVLGHAINIDQFYKKTHHRLSSTIKIGTVGRVIPEKNFELLINAVSKIKTNRKIELRLILAQANKNKKYFNKLKRLRAIHQRPDLKISLLTNISYQQIPLQLKNLDLYVHPAIVRSVDKAAIEAICSYTPVLLNNYGYSDTFQDYQHILFDPRSLNQLTRKLQSALDNYPTFSKAQRALQLQTRKYYSVDSFMERLIKLYHQPNSLS